MKIFVDILVLSLLFSACQMGSSLKKDEEVVAIGIEQYHLGAGMEQYFLPELPNWANFSATGKCMRSSRVRFLDFYKVHHGQELNYEQMIQLQLLINLGIEKMKGETNSKFLMPRDEELIFQQSLSLIKGGAREFVVTNYDSLNLLWVDGEESELIKFFDKIKSKGILELAPPVLISTCLNRQELEKMAKKFQLEEFTPAFISAEMFSPYGDNYQLNAYFSINLDLLLPKKKISFYSVHKLLSHDFRGKLITPKF